MFTPETAQVAAMIATVLAAIGAVPQVHRLVRTGDTSGVSLSNAVIGLVSEGGWVVYATHEGLWSLIPEPSLMVLSNVLLTWALAGNGAVGRAALRVGVPWAATVAACAMFGNWALLGALLSFSFAAQVAPSICAAYRTWAPTGIATTTWVLILAESVLWGIYGSAEHDTALLIFGAVGAIASTAIIARVIATRRRVTLASTAHRTASPNRGVVDRFAD